MSELSGLLRNALERGWPIQEVKQSLINAGYAPQEIELEISGSNIPSQVQGVTVSSTNPQTLKNYQTMPTEQNSSNMKFFITIGILLLLGIISLTTYFLLK